MYTMQLPNMNVPLFITRVARINSLKKVNNITVDLSCLLREEDGRVHTYVPNKEPNQLASALWLSAVINLTQLTKKPGDTAFLGKTESNFVESIITRSTRGVDATSIYALTRLLDEVALKNGYRFSLAKMNKWTDVLMTLMEGYTVMVGGTVYESFQESELTGLVRMPKPGEALLEGHIFNIVSFDQEKDMALALGNRGMNSGKRGHFQYCGSYLRNLGICRDFFVLVPRVYHGR